MSGFLFSFLSGIGEVKNRTVFFQEEASGKLESLPPGLSYLQK